MERSTPHNLSRPSSEHNSRDLRHPPAPPSPYTLQAPVRQSQLHLTNDPFLPRRSDRDDPRQGAVKSITQSPFSLDKYATYSHGESTLSNSLPPPLPPPPPSSSSSFALQDPTSQREISRHRERRTSSPRMYGASSVAQDPPPPPPPPFSARPIPSPSPQYNPPNPMSRAPPPPPPPFTGGRDLPAPSSSTRPGSSMSISSMLDSGPSRSFREPTTAVNLNGTSPTGSYTSSGAQPPPASSPARSSNGNGFLNRSSPEHHQTSQVSNNRTFRAYSGGTPQHSNPASKAGSPDGFKFGSSTAKSVPPPPQLSDVGTQPTRKPQLDGTLNIGRLVDRPGSQPKGYTDSTLVTEKRTAEVDVPFSERKRQEEDITRQARSRQADTERVSSFDFLGRPGQLERQQRLEREKESAPQNSPGGDRLSGMNYPFMVQSSVFSEPSVSAPQQENASAFDHLLEGNYQSRSSASKNYALDMSIRQHREERQRATQEGQDHSRTTSRHPFNENHDERQMPIKPQSISIGSGNPESSRSFDSFSQQTRSLEEGVSSHRSMLGLINENNKRAGRVSPLPQAVQGAQGQKRGPSSDPSIKNEFSRMFAGIGSGVGSTGLNSGASTPFPPSPKQTSEADQRMTFTDRSDLLEFAKSRNGSRARKGKRAKELESKELEISGNRTRSARGIKKSRHSQGHHHHGNHHRHHHHHVEDQNGMPSHQAGISNTPITRHLHHHHRTDGSIHFHPPSRSCNSHHKTPHVPSIQINNSSIFEAVGGLPRRHLGSTLYSPGLQPNTSSGSYDSKSTLTPIPYAIPRFEGKENCTLTVRIPQPYLTKEERKRVCQTCAVWGTDIYSDDSDPLAAAIHAGWVRGEWGDDIDFSMLELNSSDDSDTKDTVFTSVPPKPTLPMPGRDLHVTLLLLPTLQNYTPHIAHGIKSRPWGTDHDGLSYQIIKIAWIDEQSRRGEERHGESRHKRLKATLRSRTAAPPLRLGIGKALGDGMLATAAA